MATIVLQATAGLTVEAAAPVVNAAVRPALFKQKAFAQAVLRSGVTPGDIDTLVYQARTLAASAVEDLNLFDGSLATSENLTATFATLKLAGCFLLSGTGLVVGNAPANAHPLWFGAGSHTLAVDDQSPPFLVGSGYGKPVTGTSKIVRVANPTAAAVTYLLVLAGLKV